MLDKFSDFNKIHFTGIGGIGMSALAGMLLESGKEITGSERSLSKITEDLSQKGVKIFSLESGENIDKSYNLLVYTPAVSNNHSEILKAKSLGIKTLSYPQVLGLISEEYFTVAIAGTHGKTTTTAMVVHVLEDVGRKPNAIVGSLIKGKRLGDVDSNFRFGNEDLFVVEACEYKRSFLNLHPNMLVITNIEEDHLDYYKDILEIKEAFGELLSRLPSDGALVCSLNDESVRPTSSFFDGSVIDYSEYEIDETVFPFFGKHNRMNAQAAIAVVNRLGISTEDAVCSLMSFPGTWRRFEYKGKTREGALVFDDYAHHPGEVSTTILAAKEKFPDKKIVVVFQPHLQSRLTFFFDEFVESLSIADCVILTPVYQARAESKKSVYSLLDVVNALSDKKSVSYKVSSLEEVVQKTLELSDSDSVVVMMGAGDIYKATPGLVEKD